MYGQPQEYNGKGKDCDFQMYFPSRFKSMIYATTWDLMDDGMSDVTRHTGKRLLSDYNYFYPNKKESPS